MTSNLASATSNHCPVDHAQFKTKRVAQHNGQPIWQDADGIWQVQGYDEARIVLRSLNTRQAGFKAEFQERLPDSMRRPILYLEGTTHLEQRKQTARFFTPKAASAYRPIMDEVASGLISQLKQEKRANLRDLNLSMAMRVVSEVVGLTNSRLPGIAKRLDVFLSNEESLIKTPLGKKLRLLRTRLSVLLFFYLDVQPSIRARQRQPKEDLISYLLTQNYKDWEIFTECVTYGAAGMVTTREFMALALWHLLEQPNLRARYVQAGETERHAILQEILRLEPIVAQLKRRAQSDIAVSSNGKEFVIRANDLVIVNVQEVNVDETLVGADAQAICPMREMNKQVVMPSVISFGDGHHRCPGAYVSLQETDVLLRHLLALPGLRIERAPDVGWSETASGPELHNFIIAVD